MSIVWICEAGSIPINGDLLIADVGGIYSAGRVTLLIWVLLSL